ncbi:MAG: homoserine kinase [Deltaproteobacteria bacterium]|nr:homoserine kinase [Deltaproteobacteria bacterium]
MESSVRVFAPATVANVGCAYDILGFALEAPGDEVCISLSTEPGVRITAISGDGGRLPRASNQNTAAVAVQAFLRQIPLEQGVEIEVHKRMPLGSGLGSSAASAAAALHGINYLAGTPLSQTELIPFAMEAEKAACGSAHADNVAPALLGGFVLLRSYEPLDVVPLPPPPNLYYTVVHPEIELRTEDSRRILKKEILLKDAVVQWGNIAGLITGILQKDLDLIGRSLNDILIEPERSLLIPGFESVKLAALNAGALGCSLSGSGPSLFAFSASLQTSQAIGTAMGSAFADLGIKTQKFSSLINCSGPTLIKPSTHRAA